MKPIKECIIVTECQFMGLFCGSSVWVIPIKDWIYPESEDGRIYGPPIGVDLDFDRAYVCDRWRLQDGACYNTEDESCVIAVEPEQMQWKTAPAYASMIENIGSE